MFKTALQRFVQEGGIPFELMPGWYQEGISGLGCEQVEVMMQARHVQERLDGGADSQSPATHSPGPSRCASPTGDEAPGKENIGLEDDGGDEGGELLAAFERASQEIERASQDMPLERGPQSSSQCPPGAPTGHCDSHSSRDSQSHSLHAGPLCHPGFQDASQDGSQGGSQGAFMRGVLQDCLQQPTLQQTMQGPTAANGRPEAKSLGMGQPTQQPAAATAPSALQTPANPRVLLQHPRTGLLRGPTGDEAGDSGRSTATRTSLGGTVGTCHAGLGVDEVTTPGRHGSWMGTQAGVFDGSMSADDSPGLMPMHAATVSQPLPHAAAEPPCIPPANEPPSEIADERTSGAVQVGTL